MRYPGFEHVSWDRMGGLVASEAARLLYEDWRGGWGTQLLGRGREETEEGKARKRRGRAENEHGHGGGGVDE